MFGDAAEDRPDAAWPSSPRENRSAESPRPGTETKFGGIYIANESFTFESANEAIANGEADAVAFGKLFIAQPRFAEAFCAWCPAERSESANVHANGAEGYIDYPALETMLRLWIERPFR